MKGLGETEPPAKARLDYRKAEFAQEWEEAEVDGTDPVATAAFYGHARSAVELLSCRAARGGRYG